ncbi:hypothetical protein [Ferruginibacter sp.]|nr:hypothetical protein [Ferruginibacter sp.]
MATTFIDYKEDKGFYIHELFMQLAFLYIYEELKKQEYNFIKKADLLYDCKSKIDGIHSSYFVLSWDDNLVGSDDEQQMIELLKNVINNLQAKGEFISVAEMQEMPTEDGHFKSVMDAPFPVSELLRIFNALIEMLGGKWDSTNYGMDIKWR